MNILDDPPRGAEVPAKAVVAPAPVDREPRYHPLWQIVVTRVKEFYRYPSAIFWVYLFPILMAVVLGVAFQNPQSQPIAVAIVSGPGAEAVAAALRILTNQESVFRGDLVSDADARFLLRTGRAALVIVPNPSEQSPVVDSEATDEDIDFAWLKVTYLFDPTRPESVTARRAVDDTLQRVAGRRDPIAASDQRFSEPGGRYIDFVIPGLIGASLMNGGLWGVGFIVVDLRVRHLLKRFVTTPMKKSDFLAGLMLSRFFFMVTQVILLLICCRLLFGVQVLGSWLTLALFVVLGSWAFAGVGLLIASRAQTLETASGLINLIMLPMWLVSGIFFSSERFPAAFQPLIKILPLTALIDGMRAIMLEGSGFMGVLFPAAVLLIWSIACFAIALKWFRWY